MKQLNRRSFLKLSGAGVLSLYVATRNGFVLKSQAQIPGGSLDPLSVDKYVLPLVKPPAMPPTKSKGNKDQYRIAVRQFTQRILSPPHPTTTVWSYGSVDYPGTAVDPTTGELTNGTFNYPAFTIEASWNKKVSVEWRNELVDAAGNYLPHLLPVDPTLHWANPPGGMKDRDTRPAFAATPGPYTGPVPIVTHVHGAHTTEDSDGYPEAWYLPAALNIPKGYAETGTFWDYYNKKYKLGWTPGMSSFSYPNDQRATTLWYHDHTLGMTRLNVYAGPAGFWLIRGGPDDVVLDSRDGSPATLPGPAPSVGDSPLGEYGEIPIVIQDRSFNDDGSLFYPDTRAFFDEYGGPYIPDTPVSPIWNPEFFGNMMVVNGFTWPYLNVEPRRYRFRFLNGCQSRFLILDFSQIPGVEVWQIGAEGGFLAQPVNLTDTNNNQLLMALAERADLIVDFTNVPMGEYELNNLGPDEPFGGGIPDEDFDVSDPDSTGKIMQFRVSTGPVTDPTTPPQFLQLPAITDLGAAGVLRDLSLNEDAYITPSFDGPVAALLGTYDPGTATPTPLLWMDPITENPTLGGVEEWKIYNVTADAHPIHIHLVQFQVLGREVIGGGTSVAGSNDPLPWETGFKDTVISYPGEITRVKMRFDYPGFYVWHCHIVEHEDNEMMRPYHVGPIPPNAPAK